METKTSLVLISAVILFLSGFAFAASPSLSGIPNLDVRENASELDKIVDFHRYADDDRYSLYDLDFEVTSQSNSRLLDCFVENNRYLSCDAPRSNTTGSSTIRVEATNRNGNTASDSFTINVGSGSGSDSRDDEPSLTGVPDVTIRENSGYRANLLDLFRYADDDEDSDSQLDFRIVSQSNKDLVNCLIRDDRYLECEAPRRNSTGTSSIRIEAEDLAGHTDDDLMTVEIAGDGTGNCSDIFVNTRTVTMDEDDSERVTFEIRNRSDNEFRIRDVEVSDESQYLLTRNIDFDDLVDTEDETDLEMELETLNTTVDREATVSIRVRGEFDNGDVCSFSDIGTSSFRVHIEGKNSSGSSNSCGEVSVRASDVSVRENSTVTRNFTLINESSRRFTVNSIRFEESSPYFSLRVADDPSSVAAGDSERIGVRIQANPIPNDREGSARIKVSGEFSNGNTCSISSITDTFDVSVLDSRSNGNIDDDEDDGDNDSDKVDLTVSATFVTLKERESKPVGIVVRNNSGEDECFTINANDSAVFKSELTKTSFCLDDGQSESLSVKITGTKAGTETADIRLSYAGKTKSKTITIGVTGANTPVQNVLVSANINKENLENGFITLVNEGSDLSNVRVRQLSAPGDVKIESLSKDFWKSGEEVKINVDTGGFEGKIEATIGIESSQGSRNITTTFDSVEQTSQPNTTGLANVAGSAAFGLGVLALLVLAGIGLISLARRK